MSNPGPTEAQAESFALMLASGAPPSEAIRYFLPEDVAETHSGAAIADILDRWLRSKTIGAAIRRTQGKDWTDRTPAERLEAAVSKTYSEMAYFLYTRNVVELTGAELAKAEAFRKALESKLAGTAGQLTEVERFWADISAGKIKLVAQPPTGAVGNPPRIALGEAARPIPNAGDVN